MNQHIVSAEWLRNNLDIKDLIILDASPKSNNVNDESVPIEHIIPNSRHFDIKDLFSDLSSSFPNSLPSPEHFQDACRKLGISKNSMIVVYDKLGIYTSPRVWWMFRVMGHTKVNVLNGGLPEWVNAGNVTTDKFTHEYETGDFVADYDPSCVKSYENIKDNIEDRSFQLIDARSRGRFDGTASEPRKKLKSGHIPNSINIPYIEVLDNGKFKSRSELQALFESKRITLKDVVYSCGSGITACIILMAASIVDQKSLCIYDGSWTEWATNEGLTTR